VCSFPLEYCEFGSSLTRCKEWLKEENEELYDKYYSEGTANIVVGDSFPVLITSTTQRL
jgi:hypothetical protein